MDYQVAFDLGREGIPELPFLAVPLILASVGACLVYESRHARRSMRVFAWFFLAFPAVVASLPLAAGHSQRARLKALVESGQAAVVEGPVEGFTPAPPGGHAREQFSVKGVAFAYSDFVLGPGFHRTSSHGGPIRAGLPVRIAYGPKNEILKLEIPKGEPYRPPAPLVHWTPLLIFGAIVAVLTLWRSKQGRLFLPYEDSGLLFCESMISGRPLGGWRSLFSGANNALSAALTPDTLFVELIMPFRLLAPLDSLGCAHRVPLSSIRRCEKAEHFAWIPRWMKGGAQALEIVYDDEKGETTGFALYLSRRDELHDKLKGLIRR